MEEDERSPSRAALAPYAELLHEEFARRKHVRKEYRCRCGACIETARAPPRLIPADATAEARARSMDNARRAIIFARKRCAIAKREDLDTLPCRSGAWEADRASLRR